MLFKALSIFILTESIIWKIKGSIIYETNWWQSLIVNLIAFALIIMSLQIWNLKEDNK